VKLLIKLGGTLLDDEASRTQLAKQIAHTQREHQLVVVHGGGKQMTRFLAERGVTSNFINGLRVTSPEVIDAVLKVFAGSVNSGLVAAFRAAGALPVGLSGLSAGLVDAVQLDPQLGQVGRPVSANGRLLDLLVRENYLPVIACIAGDPSGNIYNVNADQMAVACAVSFDAEQLLFLTDVDGVRDESGQSRPYLTKAQATSLIAAGVATGGMQAKLESCLDALSKGVKQVTIAPGARLNVLQDLLSGAPIGTRISLT
jgi:acetylglutamate kinase